MTENKSEERNMTSILLSLNYKVTDFSLSILSDRLSIYLFKEVLSPSQQPCYRILCCSCTFLLWFCFYSYLNILQHISLENLNDEGISSSEGGFLEALQSFKDG